MIFTDDPVADAERYYAEQQAKLDKFPVCSDCEEPIQEEYCYEIGREILCEACMNDRYQVTTDWFTDD